MTLSLPEGQGEKAQKMSTCECQEEHKEHGDSTPDGSEASLPAKRPMGTRPSPAFLFDAADFKWRSLHVRRISGGMRPLPYRVPLAPR